MQPRYSHDIFCLIRSIDFSDESFIKARDTHMTSSMHPRSLLSFFLSFFPLPIMFVAWKKTPHLSLSKGEVLSPAWGVKNVGRVALIRIAGCPESPPAFLHRFANPCFPFAVSVCIVRSLHGDRRVSSRPLPSVGCLFFRSCSIMPFLSLACPALSWRLPCPWFFSALLSLASRIPADLIQVGPVLLGG